MFCVCFYVSFVFNLNPHQCWHVRGFFLVLGLCQDMFLEAFPSCPKWTTVSKCFFLIKYCNSWVNIKTFRLYSGLFVCLFVFSNWCKQPNLLYENVLLVLHTIYLLVRCLIWTVSIKYSHCTTDEIQVLRRLCEGGVREGIIAQPSALSWGLHNQSSWPPRPLFPPANRPSTETAKQSRL